MEAYKRGLRIFEPQGAAHRFDILIQGAKGYRRVQIKGTTQKRCVRILCGVGAKRKLNREAYDILALYSETYDIWYIIPSEKIVSSSVSIYPMYPQGEGPGYYEKYREQWTLLNE